MRAVQGGGERAAQLISADLDGEGGAAAAGERSEAHRRRAAAVGPDHKRVQAPLQPGDQVQALAALAEPEAEGRTRSSDRAVRVLLRRKR